MTTRNADLIRGAYAAFGRGDIAAVLMVLEPQLAWHVPGRGPLAGDYVGHDEVLGFFHKTMQLSDGTFSIDIDQILADQDRVVVLCSVSAERHGRQWSSAEVHVWRVVDGQAVQFREFQGDEQTEDEFWSAGAP